MTDAPSWDAIDLYLDAVEERMTEAQASGDAALLAEARDEWRLAQQELREMAAAGIARPVPE